MLRYFSSLILLMLLAACGSNSPSAKGENATTNADSLAPLPATFSKVYTGLLGADTVLMQLNAKDKIIDGAYFIKGNTERVILSGSVYAADSIRLEGVDAANKTTYTFNGIIKGALFSGKGSIGAFSLNETTMEFTPEKYVILDTLEYVFEKKTKKSKVVDCTADIKYPIVSNPDNKPGIAKINTDIQRNFFDVLNDCDAITAREGQAMPYTNEGIGGVVFNNGQIFGVSMDGYFNTGGAHGNYYTTTYYYDVETGSRIKLIDLFQGPSLKKVQALVIAQLKKKFKTNDLASKDIAVNLKGDENFFIDIKKDSTFIVHFNVYEISSYAAGAFDVPLKFSEVRPLVSGRTALGRFLSKP